MSDQGDDLTTALGTVLSSAATRKFAPPSQTVTKHDEQLRVALVKKFDDLDTLLGVQLRNALSSLLDLIPVVDAPEHQPLPEPPTSIEITAQTATSVSFAWTQAGTVDGWYVWVVETGTEAPIVPDDSVTAAAYTASGLTGGQSYTLYVAAHNANGTSLRASIVFQTSAGGARIVNTDATTKGAARTAALAASNGSRNATFTATEESQLTVAGKQYLVIEDDPSAGGGDDRYIEEVDVTTDGTAINIPPGTLVSALATTRASMADPYISLRKPGSAARRIAVPLATGTITGDIELTGDVQAGTLLNRGTLRLLMPPVAFDTQGGGGASTNVEALIADMRTPHDNGWFPDTYPNADESSQSNGIYAYVHCAWKPGNELWRGSYGQAVTGIISTGPYANSNVGVQPWGWIGIADRAKGFQITGLRNTATNTRLQAKDFYFYGLRIDDVWELIAYESINGAPINTSAWYIASYNNTTQIPYTGSALWEGRDETSNGGGGSLGAVGYNRNIDSVDRYGNAVFINLAERQYNGQRAKDYRDWNWHFYGAQMSARNAQGLINGYKGFVSSYDCRKALHDPMATDDRAQCPAIALGGADFFIGGQGYLTEYMHARFKKIPDDGSWMRVGISDLPADVLRGNAPPNFRGA